MARVATDPSPVDAFVPLPATVSISPVEIETLRTRELLASLMYILS